MSTENVTEKHDWTRFDAMPDAKVHEAALRDPDARPITDEEFARVERVPRIKTLRRALALTQEEFATRFQIPLGTLRDWELGRAEPDQTARAYLRAIAGDPEAVLRRASGNAAAAMIQMGRGQMMHSYAGLHLSAACHERS